MTRKEFVTLEKRLLQKIPGFVINGPLLLLPPVEHTLRGFYFEGSSFDKTSFYVTCFFLPMCVPTQHLTFTFGDRLRDKGADRWSIDDLEFEEKLVPTMHNKATFLMSLKSPENVIDAITIWTDSRSLHQDQALAYMLVRGALPNAKSALEKLLAAIEISVPWQKEIASRAETLISMLVKQPENARTQVLKWEFETIQNLRLERFNPSWHQSGSQPA